MIGAFAIYTRRIDSGDSKGLSSRELLLRAAADFTGYLEDALQTQLLPSGKPFLPGCPDVHFSVSHSGNWWLCAFGERPAGLDLQLHQRCDFRGIARRFFHRDEYAFLEATDYRSFFDIWVSKESYVKYTGRGLGFGFDGFSVVSDGSLVSHIDGKVFIRTDFMPGYSLCLCAESCGELSFVTDW